MRFEEIHERVLHDDEGKWEISLPRENIGMTEAGAIALSSEDLNGHPRTLTPSTWAFAQLCQRLGIPAGYLRRCPPQLQAPHVNHWLHQPPAASANGGQGERSTTHRAPWLLRAKSETLRAVLSASYSRIDNSQLLTHVEPVLKAPFQIGKFDLTDESLHLRIIDPHLRREVLPGDDLTVGVHISNSEVGRRSVTIDALVYRLVCTNGLIRLVKGKSLLRQRHLHVQTLRLEAAVHEAMSEALATAAAFLEIVKAATRARVKDVDETLKHLADQWNFSRPFVTQVKISLIGETPDQQDTMYGLVNALTHAAQRLPADERYDIEVLGGRLLDSGSQDSSLGLLPGNGTQRRSPDIPVLVR